MGDRSRPGHVAVTGQLRICVSGTMCMYKCDQPTITELENTSFCLIIAFFWNMFRHFIFSLNNSETLCKCPASAHAYFDITHSMSRRKQASDWITSSNHYQSGLRHHIFSVTSVDQSFSEKQNPQPFPCSIWSDTQLQSYLFSWDSVRPNT